MTCTFNEIMLEIIYFLIIIRHVYIVNNDLKNIHQNKLNIYKL